MSTKLVGDIAVQHAVLEGLKRGWSVLLPVGDRLPYDLVFDIDGRFIRVQVKSAYRVGNTFIANTRRSKTNRKIYLTDTYNLTDFDIAMLWHPEQSLFYVLPIADFLRFKSGVQLPEESIKNSRGRAIKFKNAWNMFESR